MNKPAFKPLDILIAEDNPTDVMLMREALEPAKALNTLHVVDDGVGVLEFLRRENRHAEAPRPDLILLDLDMLEKNGHEVLIEMKADEDLRAIPVVILTSSKDITDVAKAYGQYANCYVTKPMDFDAFTEAVREIHTFWLAVVTLPPP
jgi:CheY-like chemotaxis protein